MQRLINETLDSEFLGCYSFASPALTPESQSVAPVTGLHPFCLCAADLGIRWAVKVPSCGSLATQQKKLLPRRGFKVPACNTFTIKL